MSCGVAMIRPRLAGRLHGNTGASKPRSKNPPKNFARFIRGKTMSKRHHGDGGIDARGQNSFRLRYRINGKRYSQTFRGTLPEARKKLRELIRCGDTGTHIEPDKITLGEWISQWLAAGAPGKKQRRAGRSTVEQYAQLLRCHVVPVLGARRLQQLQAVEIDQLYVALADTLAPKTVQLVHVVL